MTADPDVIEITKYNWLLFAACSGKSIMFFRSETCKSNAEDLRRRRYCRELCESCPVRRFCIEDELSPDRIHARRYSMSRGGWEWNSIGVPRWHPDDEDLYQKFYGGQPSKRSTRGSRDKTTEHPAKPRQPRRPGS